MLKNAWLCFACSGISSSQAFKFVGNNPSLQIHSFNEDRGKCNNIRVWKPDHLAHTEYTEMSFVHHEFYDATKELELRMKFKEIVYLGIYSVYLDSEIY